MKNSKNAAESLSPEPIHPLDAMREAFRQLKFEVQDDGDRLSLKMILANLDVVVTSWGDPDDICVMVVNLPIHATPEARARAGEFLHRLNYNSKRKLWEIDYSDGEIRLAAYADTFTGPLTVENFQAWLHAMVQTADAAFPYLTSVLYNRMTPEFAADQAEAAILALWNRGDDADSD